MHCDQALKTLARMDSTKRSLLTSVAFKIRERRTESGPCAIARILRKLSCKVPSEVKDQPEKLCKAEGQVAGSLHLSAKSFATIIRITRLQACYSLFNGLFQAIQLGLERLNYRELAQN